MEVVLWCLLSCCFLPLCSAISCSVTQHDDQTMYSISEVPHVSSVKASDCEYSWANASQHVLAHNKDKTPELVKTHNISALVTSKCLDKIIYIRNCVSELEEYTTNCTISCSGNGKSEEDKEISHLWIVAVFFVVLVIAGFGFLCYSDKIPRMGSCRQLGCIYTAVKTQNVDPKAADVEAGNK